MSTEKDEINPFVYDCFYLFGAITFVFSMHCLLSTVFVMVFAPNLALHGPLGSMVRAVDGMLIEQDHIFRSFVVSLFSFALLTVFTFWIVAGDSTDIASTCTAILVIAMGIWYHYCLRIYNRFRISASGGSADYVEKKFENHKAAEENTHATNSQLASPRQTPAHSTGKSSLTEEELKALHGAGAGAQLFSDTHSDTGTSKTFTGSFKSIFTGKKGGRASVSDESAPPQLNPMQKVELSGYMTYSKISQNKPAVRIRHFFVLKDKHLFIYNSRRGWESKPNSSINARPIDIDEYDISSSGAVPPYTISLQPLHDDFAGWQFVCDTTHEMNTWLDAFKGISPV